MLTTTTLGTRILAYSIVLLFTCCAARAVLAQGALIPVVDRNDHVYDPHRNLLYITTDRGLVERYDVATGQLLAPFNNVGDSLAGLDITPDGSSLYVADATPAANGIESFVHKIDLTSGTTSSIVFSTLGSEGGSWDVAIGSSGKGLITTTYAGSAWVPLHDINLATDTVTERPDAPGSTFNGEVRNRSFLHRGADRSSILLLEFDTSAGPMFTYDSSSDTFSTDANIGSHNSHGSVSRDGSQILVIPNFPDELIVANSSIVPQQSFPGLIGGGIFDPIQDVLYAVDPTTDEVVAINSSSFAELFRTPIGEDVGEITPYGSDSASIPGTANGFMSISDDGGLVFLSTPQGVRVIQVVPEPTSFAMFGIAMLGLSRRRRQR